MYVVRKCVQVVVVVVVALLAPPPHVLFFDVARLWLVLSSDFL